jgi:hypothetical protein
LKELNFAQKPLNSVVPGGRLANRCAFHVRKL